MPDTPETSRTRLLTATIDLVRVNGYAATRIEDVCAAAGVTKGSFFHHFASKEDLAIAAAAQWNERAKQLFQQAYFQTNEGALGRLLAVQEAYPDLKSNQNFLALQSQLEGTENRIAVARRDYIEAVRQYNTELRTFPGLIWASTVYRSNKPMETFTVAEDVKRPPQVKF